MSGMCSSCSISATSGNACQSRLPWDRGRAGRGYFKHLYHKCDRNCIYSLLIESKITQPSTKKGHKEGVETEAAAGELKDGNAGTYLSMQQLWLKSSPRPHSSWPTYIACCIYQSLKGEDNRQATNGTRTTGTLGDDDDNHQQYLDIWCL